MVAFILLVVTFTAAVLGDIAVTRIGIYVDKNPSQDPATFTLWFNSRIYECTMTPRLSNTENACDSSTITMIGTDCSSSDTKILIDNQHPDAFAAGNVFFETSDGTTVTRYQSSAFCVSDDASLSAYNSLYKTSKTCQSEISESGHIFGTLCIDIDDCTPSKQLIHFDTSRPNEAVGDALWEDGTSVSTLPYDYNCAELTLYTVGTRLYTGDIIRAVADGRNTGASRYEVNFYIGNSVALHFNPRNKQSVVRNTYDNNRWGTEEVEGGWQLGDPTKAIELEFKITDAEYRVSYFGDRILDYDYSFKMGESAASITNIRWNNVVNGKLFIFRAKPYKKGITLHTGDVIRAVADAGASRYVRFYIGNSIALHFKPRHEDNQGITVVRNTYTGGSWQTKEERAGGYQLGDPAAPIELDFKLTDTNYEVSYFGRRIAVYDYDFRMGETAEDITDIQWGGDVVNGELFIMRRKLIFGFKTAPGTIGAHGMVVIDLYDASGAVYRCHHLGIGCGTTYQCIVGLNDNVVKLSHGSNVEGHTNKLIIRGFEFDDVSVESVFIAVLDVNDDVSAIMHGSNIAHLEPTSTSNTLSASLSDMIFLVEVSDTKARFVSEQPRTTNKFNLNGVDTQFGIDIEQVNIIESGTTVQQTRDSLLIGDISFDIYKNEDFYTQNDCSWKAVDFSSIGAEPEERNQVNDAGVFGNINAVGSAAVLAADVGELVAEAGELVGEAGELVAEAGSWLFKAAKAMGPIGNAFMLVNNIMDVIGVCLFDCGPSEEELMIQRQANATRVAMEEMTESINDLMDCNKEHTERKFTALKGEMDSKIDHLAGIIQDFSQQVNDQIDSLRNEVEDEIQFVYDRLDDRLAVQQQIFDMKMRAMEYKIHIENVEVEVAKIQDTLAKFKRQWDHINALKSSNEAFGEELSSMLQFTMPRFAGVVIRKPASDDFDFFWRLYAEELTVFVLEIMTLRVDIWSLWVHYNAIQGGFESIASIIPDYYHEFRDLNGELIVELIQLLPYAIYGIIDVESDTTQSIQRMKLTDSFKEIEYRFQPRTACVWIQYTMVMTETDDLFFLGDAEIEGLYDEDIDICAFNVRKWIINQVIKIDTSESRLYTTDNQGPDFIVQSTDYNLAMAKNGYIWSEYTITHALHSGFMLDRNSKWVETISHSAPIQQAVVGFTWDIVPSWYCEESKQDEYYQTTRLYFHYHLSGFKTWYSTGESDTQDIRSSIGYPSTDAVTSATAQCKAGFAASAIRLGYHDFGRDTFTRAPKNENIGNTFSRELVGFKLLCRPTSTEPDDWYRTFTLYEIASAKWFDQVVDVYSKWYSCPIGTVIRGIDYNYNYQVDSSGSQRAFTSGIKLKCGNVQKLNLLGLISSNDLTIDIPDIHHPGDSYFNLAKYISSPSIFLFAMVFTFLAQILFCVFRYGKVVSKRKKIEHFDNDSATDDTDIDAI